MHFIYWRHCSCTLSPDFVFQMYEHVADCVIVHRWPTGSTGKFCFFNVISSTYVPPDVTSPKFKKPPQRTRANKTLCIIVMNSMFNSNNLLGRNQEVCESNVLHRCDIYAVFACWIYIGSQLNTVISLFIMSSQFKHAHCTHMNPSPKEPSLIDMTFQKGIFINLIRSEAH